MEVGGGGGGGGVGGVEGDLLTVAQTCVLDREGTFFRTLHNDLCFTSPC